MSNKDMEVFKFKYESYGEYVIKRKVADIAIPHSQVVSAFFDFMEEAYGYDIRCVYLKDDI